MTHSLGTLRQPKPAGLVLAILVIAAATIVGAWIFQALGYAPCELCLKERIPYYVGIAAAVVTLVIASRGSAKLLTIGLSVLALIFAASAIFGAFHAGVEWGFWPGPSDCTGALDKAASVGDFMKQLQTVKVVRCDAVAIRILGLSLAGWNAGISAVLTVAAVVGAKQAAKTDF